MMYPFQGPAARLTKDVVSGPVEQFSINPMIIHSEVVGGKYYFTFQNMCYTGQPIAGNLVVNKNTLKQKLEAWVKPNDRKYIKIVDFNSTKSKFVFDIDSWIEDGLKNCKPYNNNLSLSKGYKLGCQLPYMVSVYGMEMAYGKLVSERFKEILKSKPELRKNVFGIIEDISEKKLKIKSTFMFDYRYDKIMNSVIVSVKPTFISSIMATATILAQDKSWKKKVDFDKKVGMFFKFK